MRLTLPLNIPALLHRRKVVKQQEPTLPQTEVTLHGLSDHGQPVTKRLEWTDWRKVYPDNVANGTENK